MYNECFYIFLLMGGDVIKVGYGGFSVMNFSRSLSCFK